MSVMRYKNVCLEALAYTLPDEIVTSDEIERRLAPVYERLRLPEGRLELMTGIRERRFWPAGTLPGQISVVTAERALAAARIDRSLVGALVHGSVCRDYLEPATASGIHHALGLDRRCHVYDISNACLGILNAMVQVANMIELGHVRAGLVVGTESGRALVETTIEHLNRSSELTRDEIKLAVASLTIGSASAAAVLVHRDISHTQIDLHSATVYADTRHHELCKSGRDESAANGMRPLMNTDSERLMREGVQAAAAAFDDFLAVSGWRKDEIDKTFCHQVGVAHRKLLLETLGLSPKIDFTTVEFLGNTGAAALPATAAIGVERGWVEPGDRVAFLGIGSGINVVMLGLQWPGAEARA